MQECSVCNEQIEQCEQPANVLWVWLKRWKRGPVDEAAFVDKVEFGATVLIAGDPRPGTEAPVAEGLASFEVRESINPPGSGLILQNIKFMRKLLFEKQPSQDLRAYALHQWDSRRNQRSCAICAVSVQLTQRRDWQ
jgi:hypothetical protein